MDDLNLQGVSRVRPGLLGDLGCPPAMVERSCWTNRFSGGRVSPHGSLVSARRRSHLSEQLVGRSGGGRPLTWHTPLDKPCTLAMTEERPEGDYRIDGRGGAARPSAGDVVNGHLEGTVRVSTRAVRWRDSNDQPASTDVVTDGIRRSRSVSGRSAVFASSRVISAGNGRSAVGSGSGWPSACRDELRQQVRGHPDNHGIPRQR